MKQEKPSRYHPLLQGAIELHVHSSPSIFPRKQTDWELVENVWEARMAGVVIKAHEGETVNRATLLREKFPSLHIYGGLVLNAFTGGLSPLAVDIAIQMGAKVIWMPTLSAEQHQRYYRQRSTGQLYGGAKGFPKTPPLKILDSKGKLLSEVVEILHLIAEANIILATGHLSNQEVHVLVQEAKQLGIEKILIQHVDLGITRLPLEEQKKLASMGCILEKCYLACGPDFNNLTVAQMADSIREIGPESCVLVTDYGQQHNMPPVKALSTFIEQMLENGISESSIERMVSKNPKQLLDIL